MEVNKNPNPPPSGSPPVSQTKPVRQTTNFSWEQVAAQRADEIARLTAIVDRLPKTADGKPVVPCVDTVWRKQSWGIRDIAEHEIEAHQPYAQVEYDFVEPHDVCKCYSTREAALAAAQPSDAEVSDG